MSTNPSMKNSTICDQTPQKFKFEGDHSKVKQKELPTFPKNFYK